MLKTNGEAIHKNVKSLYFAFTLIIAIAFLFFKAQAATVSYFLDQKNAGLPDDNYLQITISDSTTNIGDIDFLVEVLGDAFPVQGSNFGMDKFFFNFENQKVTLTRANIVIDDPGWGIRRFRRADGFGRYQWLLKGNGNSRTDMLTFSIVGIEGDSPADYAAANDGRQGSDEFFAAHIAGFFGDYYDGSVSCGSNQFNDGRFHSAFFAGSTAVPIPGTAAAVGLRSAGALFNAASPVLGS